MQKLLLLSIVIATIAIPIWAGRDPSAHRAVKKTVFFLFAFNVAYVFALRFLFFLL